jgi:alpha-1,3-rhamnosyl/mannosyltransferase
VTSEFRKTKNFFWKKTAHWADKIITISEFSKQEVSKYFDLPLDMISSIPLGVDDKWFRKISGRQIEEVLAKYQLPGGHFLSIGTLQPRKNVGRSIEAYMSLPLSFRRDHPFVVVGRSGWGCQKLVESLEQNKYGNSVRWLSHLPEEELFALVKSAKALVFPTLFEGFGLPVLEAFAAGLPVISSNMSSIPEVAGDAAILIDPYNPEDIGSAMLEVVNDVDLFVDLSNKGFNRAKEFTWKRTALETLKLYSHVLDLN